MNDFHLTNPEPHVPISAEAVEEIREVLIATRDRGGVGGIGLDLVRGATNALEELDALAEEYDCLVSGPYVGDDENGGGFGRRGRIAHGIAGMRAVASGCACRGWTMNGAM